MTTSTPLPLEGITVDSSLPILPTHDSSDESIADVSNDMRQQASGIMNNIRKGIIESNDAAIQNSNNVGFEEIVASSVSKKARLEEVNESSDATVARSHSLATKNNVERVHPSKKTQSNAQSRR